MKAIGRPGRVQLRLLAAGELACLCCLCSTLGPMTKAHADQDSRPSLTLLVFGDSLTAGYMLPPGDSFPAQVQMALQAKSYKVQVINAGVSGDTSADGLQRLDWSLQGGADAVIVELGANDALRGIDPALTRTNLDKILAALTAKGADILVAGMRAPNNWGADYSKAFDAIYPDLSKKYGTALYPFFLDGVALDPKFVMQDGLHPTATGVAEIVRRILPDVEKLIAKTATRLSQAK